MSGYIVCPSASMFLAPADRAMPHYRRPPHQPRHRPDDRRYGHLGAPNSTSPGGAAMPRHHRVGNMAGHHHQQQPYHPQHLVGDNYGDYHYHPQHHLFNPWNIVNCPGLYRLHEEIISFFEDMRPRPEERLMRDDVVRRITDAIRNRWSGTRVEVFGSMKTGLYLPTSDIDLVVFHSWERTPFYEIRDELLARGICTDCNIKVLNNASVPIIKLTDQLTQVKVDIGFNIVNGQRSADLVQSYIRQFPALPYLVIVLKQFLYQRELNEVYSGGISSYSLILLTISFLQSHVGRSGYGANYGLLLLEFFELYSTLFQYQRVVVSVTRGGRQEIRQWTDSIQFHEPSLSIEDPLCNDNDVARGSYNVSRVQCAFAGALHELLSEIFRPVYVCPSPKGMLSSIVRVPAEIERYRAWVQARFPISSTGANKDAGTAGRDPYAPSSSSSGISSASSPEPRASCSSASSISSGQETDDYSEDDETDTEPDRDDVDELPASVGRTEFVNTSHPSVTVHTAAPTVVTAPVAVPQPVAMTISGVTAPMALKTVDVTPSSPLAVTPVPSSTTTAGETSGDVHVTTADGDKQTADPAAGDKFVESDPVCLPPASADCGDGDVVVASACCALSATVAMPVAAGSTNVLVAATELQQQADGDKNHVTTTGRAQQEPSGSVSLSCGSEVLVKNSDRLPSNIAVEKADAGNKAVETVAVVSTKPCEETHDSADRKLSEAVAEFAAKFNEGKMVESGRRLAPCPDDRNLCGCQDGVMIGGGGRPSVYRHQQHYQGGARKPDCYQPMAMPPCSRRIAGTHGAPWKSRDGRRSNTAYIVNNQKVTDRRLRCVIESKQPSMSPEAVVSSATAGSLPVG